MVNDKHIKCFVINLEKDKERRENMQKLFNKYNINYEIFKAIEGNKLTSKEIDKFINHEASFRYLHRLLKKGEIGCLLSHREIYKKIEKEKLENALIFEDDIYFDENLISFLNYIEKLPREWEIILLGYHNDGEKIPIDPLTKKHIFNNYKVGKPLLFPYGTHAYLINKRGVRKLLEKTQTFYKPIDHYTGNIKEINTFIVSPVIVKLNNNLANQSNIYLSDFYKEDLQHKKIKRFKILNTLKRIIKIVINFIINRITNI